MDSVSVKAAIEKADTNWEEVSVKDLARVLASMLDRKVIKHNKLEEVIPIAKTKTALKSFNKPRNTANATNKYSKFIGNTRNPTDKELQTMIGLLVAEGVDIVMSNHFYTISDDIGKEEEGGAIGSDMKGEVTRKYMLQWEKN